MKVAQTTAAVPSRPATVPAPAQKVPDAYHPDATSTSEMVLISGASSHSLSGLVEHGSVPRGGIVGYLMRTAVERRSSARTATDGPVRRAYSYGSGGRDWRYACN